MNVSLNIWQINNIKKKGLQRLNPHGNKLDAVRLLKSKIHDIGNPYQIILKIYDDVYICNSCDYISESQGPSQECDKFCSNCSMIPMEHVGPSVFITSRDSLGTLRDLKAKGSLETEACCLDHQPSRLREFTTFAAYCYDVDLRRMCPLFAAVMTNERELAVYHCLEVVDRCLQEEYGASECFDPALIIADEATAIKNAVARKLGVEKVQKQYGTCMLHFKFSVLQHCSYVIGNKKQIWQFMKIAENLMNAESPEIYKVIKEELVKFISQTEQRYDHLHFWLEFYDNRKCGWARAFRNPELPMSNKAEAGNAHYSAVTHLTGLPLDLGVKCIVSEMHVYSGCKQGIKTGQYKGGNGPTRVRMEEKMLKATFDRIKNTPLTSDDSDAFVQDIIKRIGLKEPSEEEVAADQNKIPSRQRSVLQTHKFLEDQIRARTDARIDSPKFINAPHKAPKKGLKRKIKFSDTLEDLERDDDMRKKPKAKKSDNFNEKIFQTLSDGFSIKTNEIGVYELTIKDDSSRCYTVSFKENPRCTCPEFERIQKARQQDRSNKICKHISVVLLCLGFEFNTQIIRRYNYNATERMLLNLKTSVFSHKNVDIDGIKKKVENEINGNKESPQKELPFHNPKKYYGQYKNFPEAKCFIDEHAERYPCKWFALKYEEKRYLCTSAEHVTQEAKKLRPNLMQGKPLVFLVYFTRIFKNKQTGRYSARDEKKYFHMNIDCISNFGSDLRTFTNIQPPSNVDISRLSDENKTFVKKMFLGLTFVENVE